MGSIMNAKYKGTCQYCDSEWKVGDKIYYQKTPKAICSEERCFNEQGGKVSEWKPQDKKSGSFNTQPDTNLKMDIPDVPVSDGVKQCAEMVLQCLVTAHHMTKSLYPKLDEETHTFGQIRSKITDQLLSVCHLTKE